MKYRFFTLLMCFIIALNLEAQDDFNEFRKIARSKFEQYRNSRQKDFEDYRRKKNADFAKYISDRWELFKVFKGDFVKSQPKPVKPVVIPDKSKKQDVVKLPIRNVISPAKPPILDNPVIRSMPVKDTKIPTLDKVRITFFGTPCYIGLKDDLKFSINGTDEKEISKAIQKLSGKDYDDLFSDCVQACRSMNLNGWATLLFFRTVSEKLLGKGNEAVILQAYMLANMGYDARMCCYGRKLYLMTTSSEDVAYFYFIRLDGKKYYIWDRNYSNESIRTYEKNMTDAVSPIDFDNPTDINFEYSPTQYRAFVSNRYASMKVSVNVNKNLIDYYGQMPFFSGTPWNIYARQALDSICSVELMPQLKQMIYGKSELESVNMLLNWIQTGFDYKTDNEQFGYEKPFFMEEMFFYPYCDCEDRSILFSYLIRHLVGLDVVLVYTPGHLFTAVKFKSDVTGNYISLDKEKYIICDPTYIGASVGQCMPQYLNSNFDVIRIK